MQNLSIIIEHECFIYSIQQEENAALIIGNKNAIGDIIIPRSIIYKSNEYIITSISEDAFKSASIKSIEFVVNSEVRKIKNHAFAYSSIERFIAPPHLTYIGEFAFTFCPKLKNVDLPNNSEQLIIGKFAFYGSSIESLSISSNQIIFENGWCNDAPGLNKITINPNNPYYKIYDNKFIIGKSKKSDVFDFLVFAIRSITEVKIPDFIKTIGPYAFNECKKISTIEIPINSKLKKIGEYAFDHSSIESIKIPPNLTHICNHGFSSCTELSTIEIPINSKLRVIEESAFAGSFIESLTIPSSLIDLKEGWCVGTPFLTDIRISPNNPRYSLVDNKVVVGKSSIESNIYDIVVFGVRNIRTIKIPSFIKIIASFAFDRCAELYNVEIPENSELQTINEYAFSSSSIERFSIPSHLKHLKEGAFSDSNKLRKLDIPENSELQTIESVAFSETLIESLRIPSKVTYIGEQIFFDCHIFRIIEIHENSKLKYIEKSIFEECNHEIIIMIPINCIDHLKSKF